MSKELSLILHAYNGLEDGSKKAVVAAVYAKKQKMPFKNKSNLQDFFSFEVTQKAIDEVNRVKTSYEMRAKIESQALGLWVYGYNQVTPKIPALPSSIKSIIAGKVLDYKNKNGNFNTRGEIRSSVARAMIDTMRTTDN